MTHRTDRSRGDLPPAETLQSDPEPGEPIGWAETIATSMFLVALFAWAILA